MGNNWDAFTQNIQSILEESWLLIVLVGFSLMGFWLFYQKKSATKLNWESIDVYNTEEEESEFELENSSKPSLSLTQDTTQNLLAKLDKFEKSERYLKKDVKLSWMATYLNTNTKYVTEIIRIHSGKNFNQYINGLRIQYITQKLTEEPIYREYKIWHLADLCGFSSTQVFTLAFKKEKNLTPSQFIEGLKNPE